MIPMDTPTETHGKRLLKFQWILAELREDLENWSDNYSVEVTLKDEEPGTIWMKFLKGEDGAED